MVSKQLLRVIVVPILIGALMTAFLPFSANAQEDTDRPARDGGARFCENLDTIEENVLTRLEERKGRTDRSDEVSEKRAARLAELETHREERDAARAERYDALRDKAATDEQTAAVDTFADAVEALMADRKSAVDDAIDAFEDAIEALLDERDEAIGTYADDISDQIETIFDDAEAACEDDTPSVEVREQLKVDMVTMREGIKADREQYSFKDDLEAARTTRKASFEAARDIFKTGLEAAKVDLRAAFEA